MCNRLHHNSVKIPQNGIGWKLFTLQNNKLYPLVNMDRPYEKRNENAEYIEFWGNGAFCFFLYKPKDWIAFRFARENIVCLQIKYKDGLGKHIEDKFLHDAQIEIALCKSFKLVGNEENKKYHF